MCSPGNTFKSDVQSALLTIISELLAKRMFMLLAPTVHIWARDMVDFVITEMGDNKVAILRIRAKTLSLRCFDNFC